MAANAKGDEMNDNRPAIDQICDTLKCTPGQAPGRVRELVERAREYPGDEPPPLLHNVLVRDCYDNQFVGYKHRDGAWVSRALGEDWPYEIVAWQELPLVSEVTK